MTGLARLPIPARTVEQDTAIADVVRAAPGGKWILEHVHEGPYYLAVLRNTYEQPHWTVAPLLDTSTRFDVAINDDGLGVEDGRVYLLTEYARDLVMWWSDENGLRLDDDLTVGPFDDVPTHRDLANLLADLLTGADQESALRDTLRRCAAAGIMLDVPALLHQLTATDADTDTLATLLDAILSERKQ